jgi:hypothetical protein
MAVHFESDDAGLQRFLDNAARTMLLKIIGKADDNQISEIDSFRQRVNVANGAQKIGG